MSRILLWIVIGAVGVAAVSALIAQAPERLRPILLMPVLFGAATGFALGALAAEWKLPRSGRLALVAALLAVGGLVNVARISFDRLAAAARRNVQEDPQQLIGLQLLQQDFEGNTPGSRQYELSRLRLRPQFEDYLMGRLLGIGWQPRPWPAVIWGTELLIAAGLAGWMMDRRHRAGGDHPETREADQADTENTSGPARGAE